MDTGLWIGRPGRRARPGVATEESKDLTALMPIGREGPDEEEESRGRRFESAQGYVAGGASSDFVER